MFAEAIDGVYSKKGCLIDLETFAKANALIKTAALEEKFEPIRSSL